jgi:quercetin dioxygenase-like cupin family protein
VTEPRVIPPRTGEIVGDAPDRRVEILCDHDALHATWSRFGPGRDGADLHVHYHHDDCFYVLDGEFTLRLGPDGGPVTVPAGALARMPHVVVHGFRNASEAEVRYLNLHAPGQRFAEYMRAMRDGRDFTYDQHEPPADGGRPPSEAVIGGAEPLPGGATLLADAERIAVAELRGEHLEAPHVHDHLEACYVLEGELEIGDGAGRVQVAGAGAWVELAPGTPHAIRAPRSARFLSLHAPGSGFGAFLRALGDAGGDEAQAAERSGFDRRPRD